MQLTITTLADEVFALDVSEDLELENFKALCEFETGVAASEISIIWNGRPLHDDKMTLKQYGVANGDMLLLQHMHPSAGPTPGASSQPAASARGGLPAIDFGSIQIPGLGPSPSRSPGPSSRQAPSQGGFQQMMEDPLFLRDYLLNDPHQLSLLKERNPSLADALLSGNQERFVEEFRRQQSERVQKETERRRLLTADPFDPDVQQSIAEEIRMKNVDTNMETAMEFAPESFGQVVMLYIDCQVNGHPVKAFVDSGAQMTIMSQRCAERCNIMRLVDHRWAGVAKGVGTQKIIGRVHLCQIQIGPDFLQSSFSILADQPMDMLLGLDMLRRHQCSIDLKRNLLIIGTTGTETSFLSEGDLPEHARLNLPPSEPRSVEMEDQELAQAIAESAEAANRSLRNQNASSNGAATTSSSQPSSRGRGASYPEEVVRRLMDQGFSRMAVLEELRRANGNADQALAALLAKSLRMP